MTLSRGTFISFLVISTFFVIDCFVVGPAYDDAVLPLYLFREQRRGEAVKALRQHLIEPDDTAAFQLRGTLRH
jgi:hypothetical protein